MAVKQDATERASVGGERLSALVEEASQLRQEVGVVIHSCTVNNTQQVEAFVAFFLLFLPQK